MPLAASEKRYFLKFTDKEWHENRNSDTFDSGRESGYNAVRYKLQRPVIYGNLQKCAGTSSCRGGNPLRPVFFVPVSHFPGKEQQRHGRKEEYFNVCGS